MARRPESGRSKRKIVEWLIVEVARNAGEDYIVRPPMDAMRDSTDENVRKFWLATVWNGQHNEGPFRVAMAGATGLTNIMIESLPFLSDFVRDQSQEVLEQLTNSLLIYCKKQDKLPEEPRPTITLDDLIKAIPARFGEGWKATADSMRETLTPHLDKMKLHLPQLGRKHANQQMGRLAEAVRNKKLTRAQHTEWMTTVAALPHHMEPVLHTLDEPLSDPEVIKSILRLKVKDDPQKTLELRMSYLEHMATDTFGEGVDRAISGAMKTLKPGLRKLRDAVNSEKARRGIGNAPTAVSPATTPTIVRP